MTDHWNPFETAGEPEEPSAPSQVPAAGVFPHIEVPPAVPATRRALRESREFAAKQAAAGAGAGGPGPGGAGVGGPGASGPGPGPSGYQGPPTKGGKPRKPGRTRRVVTGTVITCLALGIGGAGVYIGKLAYNKLTSKSEADITDFPGPGHSEASITIDEGDPGSRIAEKLVAAGVIATVAPFIKAFNDAGDAAAGIQPGTYRLRLQMSAADALTALMDPASRLAVAFTVAEGKRTDEVYAIVGLALATAQDQPAATGEEVEAEIAAQTEAVRLAAADTAAIGLPPEANGLVEGWLFPETYSFNIGVTPTEILAKMVETCVGVLEELNVPRERWLEVVTTASLLEKESKLSSDRPKVARVIQNRLAKGMKLQFDSTVVYGVGRFDANVYTSQAERDDPNPWNTYYVDGLPAGAICNPGKETLDAAMNPAAGEWLYFCAHNLETGETDFGVTAEDHARCVQKLRQWEAEHS